MKHGGDISQALKAYGNQDKDWLDLSTGIAPAPYPISTVPLRSWQQLPQSVSMDKLLESARHAYLVPAGADIAAAPGTQLLIQLLPYLHPGIKRIRILGPTYSEHALCWQRHAADTQTVTKVHELAGADVAVVTNPNNPDGRILSPADLLEIARPYQRKGGLVVVDEAFADVAPDVSVVPYSADAGLIVLRSFGKFYGLAGLRLGFAIGNPAEIQRLKDALGLWAVSGPACEIAAKALRDDVWANKARKEYLQQATRLDSLLTQYGLEIIGGTSLFRLARHDRAGKLHVTLARQGIWTRKFDQNPFWLRFGLPGHDGNFKRLEAALVSTRNTPGDETC